MSKPEKQYVDVPRCTIDVSALRASRFLLQDSCKLPYRDESGRIVLCLLEESLSDVHTQRVVVPDDVLSKLQKWERHCRQAVVKAKVTWTDLGNGLWRSTAGEERCSVDLSVAKGAAPTAAATPETGGGNLCKTTSRTVPPSAATAAATCRGSEGGDSSRHSSAACSPTDGESTTGKPKDALRKQAPGNSAPGAKRIRRESSSSAGSAPTVINGRGDA